MAKKAYKHDKVQWDRKAQKFLLKWVDAVAALKGENKNKKSTRKWKGLAKPTKEEIEIEKAKLEEEIRGLEKRLEAEAERIKFGISNKVDDVILVHEYFEKLPDSELCHKASPTEEAIKKRRRVANALVAWSKTFYPNLYLHEVREKHIKEYFNWRKTNHNSRNKKFDKKDIEYSFGSLDGERKIIQRFFKELCKTFIDSELPYRNPLISFQTDSIVKKKASRYTPLSPELMKSLYSYVDEAKGYTKGDYKLQLKAMVYLHLITGWRTEQVCSLKWESIDFASRLITVTHSKTEEQGTRTILYISDKGMDILKTIKEKFKNNPLNQHPKMVFGLRKHSGGEKAGVAQMKAYFNTWREKMGLKTLKLVGLNQIHNYSVESIRCGVIQELSAAKFNVELVNYMAGHSNGSINSNHYLMFETNAIRNTKDMVLKMEELAGIQFWNEEARILSETNKQKERLKQARSEMGFGQGGFLLDVDPVTGKQIKLPL